MITSTMSPSIKRKCAFFGSRVSAKMEIIALFSMKILKKSYLCVNTSRKLASALKGSNVFTDIIFICTRIQMEIFPNSTMQMVNTQETRYAPILKEVFVTKAQTADS
jgi:hypothetical protein